MAAAGAATTNPTAAAAMMNGATNTIGIATAPALKKRKRKSAGKSNGREHSGHAATELQCGVHAPKQSLRGVWHAHLLLCIPPSSCQEILWQTTSTWPGRVHARKSGAKGA